MFLVLHPGYMCIIGLNMLTYQKEIKITNILNGLEEKITKILCVSLHSTLLYKMLFYPNQASFGTYQPNDNAKTEKIAPSKTHL